MISVASYAHFIRTQQLDNVVNEQVDLYCAENILFIKNLCETDKEKAKAYLKERLDHFLQALENEKAAEYFEERLQLFRNNAIPDVSVAMLNLEDVLLMASLQKRVLLKYMTSFSSDVKICSNIQLELDAVYHHLQKLFFQVFKQIHDDRNTQVAESEERYRDLFDNAHDLIHIVKPDGSLIYVNKAWSNTLGYDVDEIKGMSIYSFIHPEDKQRFFDYRVAILSKQLEDKEIVVRLKSKTGKEIVVEGFASVFFKNGVAEYTRGIFRDITNRVRNESSLKQINDQLLEREENLKQLIYYAPDAIIVIDAESKILLWNSKAQEIFGWGESEVMGKNISNIIIPQQYRDAHDAGMKRYLATGEAHVLNKTIEITALNKEEKEFYISLTISNYKRGGENVFISFLRDISEEKRNQLELDRKKKELDQSHKELEQYGWLTSHDLREPLRKILTYSDMILTRNENLPVDVKTNLYKIHDAGKRMSSLIQSILLYSSLTGEKDMFLKTDLNKIIEEVLVDLELSIKENHATIEKSELPVIDAIPFQMRQLFQNLLSNSIKYQKTDIVPVISINAVTRNNIVEIVLEDNGIGFNSQDNSKAFQLFQRLHADRKTEGTGIGLAICKKIVVGHGGTITAQSEPNKGARFIIQLPIQQVY